MKPPDAEEGGPGGGAADPSQHPFHGGRRLGKAGLEVRPVRRGRDGLRGGARGHEELGVVLDDDMCVLVPSMEVRPGPGGAGTR
ncbi:MAG: hypothetical protein AMXMBFR53_41320 [Gemmatimonadota bacterium]